MHEDYRALLPRPTPEAHKNTRGRVLIVAGSGAFPGAAALAAMGAQRMGAGYVTVAVPESVVGCCSPNSPRRS
jgi:ADP-dependent NAD(P)H-hydrate dehydratase / NAD(P)H-hydrate epimerase